MLYTKEFDIRSFKFWSGGEDHINDLREANLLDEAEQAINSIFADDEEAPTDTTINDLVWHDFSTLLEIMEVAYCENCSALFSVNDEDAIQGPNSDYFCSIECAEAQGFYTCNECDELEKPKYQTKEGLTFCSLSCLDSYISYLDDKEEAFQTVESLFPKDKITIEFLEAQENLTTDEQIAVDVVIEVLTSL